jgi:DNA-binding NarL/FixJ family response regulator
MDMAMPGLDGVQATREILKHEPDSAVLILSMYSEENYVRNALDAGARGYLLKEALDVDLAGAVKALAAGQQVIGPGVLAPAACPIPSMTVSRRAKSRSWSWPPKANRTKPSPRFSI